MTPAYATFGRRLRALVIDWIVLATVVVVIVIVGDAMRHVPGSGRVLVVMLYALILYEPIMVWRYGATIGHQATNLRVVDDVSGGNPGFFKSLARFVMKVLLGLYSFATMATTRRRQAVHDVMTHTTVQVRDMSKAVDGDYYVAPEEPSDLVMPPPWRRVIAIVLYLVITFVGGAASFGFVAGLLGYQDDNAVTHVFSITWLASTVLTVMLGWNGQLPGARRRRSPP